MRLSGLPVLSDFVARTGAPPPGTPCFGNLIYATPSSHFCAGVKRLAVSGVSQRC